MAGSIPLSLQTIFDNEGNIASGGRAYFIQAGTVATPQNAYQDSALTIPWANYYTLPASGRLPLLYFADGYIKVRITDSTGTQIFSQDNIPVTGFSSGGGGGGTIDPTTVLQAGQIAVWYGTGVQSGFVRANGRTMGNASSGATERANADTVTLWTLLYNADANLSVSGGRGASAAADYAANKTISLPDWRGRAIAGLDDMGNSAASRLTATYFGTAATVLGAASTPTESKTILTANLPAYTPQGSLTVASAVSDIARGSLSTRPNTGGPLTTIDATFAQQITSTGTLAGAAQGGVSTPFSIVQPTMLATIYLKL